MSNEIEAVTEGARAVQEVAKTTGKALDAAQEGGAYLSRMLGTVPEDVVGLLGGDLLRQYRIRNWDRISQKTFDKLDQRGIETTPPLRLMQSIGCTYRLSACRTCGSGNLSVFR